MQLAPLFGVLAVIGILYGAVVSYVRIAQRPEQLHARRGEVRCGHCFHPFNALEHASAGLTTLLLVFGAT